MIKDGYKLRIEPHNNSNVKEGCLQMVVR